MRLPRFRHKHPFRVHITAHPSLLLQAKKLGIPESDCRPRVALVSGTDANGLSRNDSLGPSLPHPLTRSADAGPVSLARRSFPAKAAPARGEAWARGSTFGEFRLLPLPLRERSPGAKRRAGEGCLQLNRFGLGRWLVCILSVTLGTVSSAASQTPSIDLTAPPSSPVHVYTDGAGNIQGAIVGGDLVPFRTELRVPSEGWGDVASTLPWQAHGVEHVVDPSGRKWKGALSLEGPDDFRYEQTITETNGVIGLRFTVRAIGPSAAKGAWLFVYVPVADFAGGRVQLCRAGERAEALLPPEMGVEPRIVTNLADRVVFESASGQTRVRLWTAAPHAMEVQDTRPWGDATYSLLIRVSPLRIRFGEEAGTTLYLAVDHRTEDQPAQLTVDPGHPLYPLQGFGGNFCFELDSPVTHFTLDTLDIAWARTQISLEEWAPENPRRPPGPIDWAACERRDRPDSPLRRELLLDRELQDRGIPYCVSIWYLPRGCTPTAR